MAQLVTLGEWAKRRALSLSTIRNAWVPHEDFPAPVRPRARAAGTGPGARHQEYDLGELDTWLSGWEAERRPPTHSMPEDPESYRTLGTIAGLLGLNGKTLTQYRDRIDQCADFEDRGARRYYRTREVVEFLNSRAGFGLSADASADRRRRKPQSATSSE
ncbi:hypothetical protein ACWIGI_05570 [Nocardia sp. NPDC055321]